MKKTATLLLLSSLVVSSSVLAADGTIPKCTSGRFNFAIVNKDVGGCPGDPPGHYCVYNTYGTGVGTYPWKGFSCSDDNGAIININTNESYSSPINPKTAEISHTVGSDINGHIRNDKTLKFIYDHGTISDNCTEVFGSDVKCVITQSGDSEHITYTLTISKVS